MVLSVAIARSSCTLVRNANTRVCQCGITLTPEGKSYSLSGEWDLVGDVRSDGAGGPDRTTRVYKFGILLVA